MNFEPTVNVSLIKGWKRWKIRRRLHLFLDNFGGRGGVLVIESPVPHSLSPDEAKRRGEERGEQTQEIFVASFNQEF